jgi:hypothetical protein
MVKREKEIAMNTNIGTADRVARIVIGLALIGATLGNYIGVWGWIGIVPLATAMIGFCPAYRLLGIGTCARRAG